MNKRIIYIIVLFMIIHCVSAKTFEEKIIITKVDDKLRLDYEFNKDFDNSILHYRFFDKVYNKEEIEKKINETGHFALEIKFNEYIKGKNHLDHTEEIDDYNSIGFFSTLPLEVVPCNYPNFHFSDPPIMTIGPHPDCISNIHLDRLIKTVELRGMDKIIIIPSQLPPPKIEFEEDRTTIKWNLSNIDTETYSIMGALTNREIFTTGLGFIIKTPKKVIYNTAKIESEEFIKFRRPLEERDAPSIVDIMRYSTQEILKPGKLNRIFLGTGPIEIERDSVKIDKISHKWKWNKEVPFEIDEYYDKSIVENDTFLIFLTSKRGYVPFEVKYVRDISSSIKKIKRYIWSYDSFLGEKDTAEFYHKIHIILPSRNYKFLDTPENSKIIPSEEDGSPEMLISSTEKELFFPIDFSIKSKTYYGQINFNIARASSIIILVVFILLLIIRYCIIKKIYPESNKRKMIKSKYLGIIIALVPTTLQIGVEKLNLPWLVLFLYTVIVLLICSKSLRKFEIRNIKIRRLSFRIRFFNLFLASILITGLISAFIYYFL